MKSEIVTDQHISLYTEMASCAELDRWPVESFKDINCEIVDPVFWFCRLKAKVEGQGEGTKLMTRLVEILDEKGITVVNGLNPYGLMKMKDLKIFYQKYGFEDVGKNIMVRHPRRNDDEC